MFKLERCPVKLQEITILKIDPDDAKFVKGYIGSLQLTWLLDTGACVSLIKKDIVDRLNLSILDDDKLITDISERRINKFGKACLLYTSDAADD